MKFAGKSNGKKSAVLPNLSESISPFLPNNISQLLPSNNGEDNKTTFVAVGPILIDALSSGKNIYEAAEMAHLHPNDAVRLLATPEFARYVEAYISIGDLKDKDARIRLSKAILASVIADGVTVKKRDPLDILEFIRKEQDSKRSRNGGVHVHLTNQTVPRPYRIEKEVVVVEGNEKDNGTENTVEGGRE